MRKIFSYLCIAVVAIAFAACSGNASYNPKACADLEKKIQNKQEMSESDYNDMIDQMDAILEKISAKDEELKDDPEKLKEYANSEEVKDLLKYTFTFGIYLDSHEDQLSDANKKKLQDIQKKFENKKK